MIGNLLNSALGLIGHQTLSYKHFTGYSVSDIGVKVSIYEEPIFLRGSFQPVPKELYEVNGLDFKQQWFVFYTSKDILEIGEDTSSDILVYNSKRYQVTSKNDWLDFNGWVGVLCVRI